MYIKKYWGNFIGGSDDSLNLVAFLVDQKKEEIPLSEIFAKIGLDKQNWDFRQTVEYLEFTHSDGVEMDFHFAIDVVTDLAAILLECSVSGSVNLQDLDDLSAHSGQDPGKEPLGDLRLPALWKLERVSRHAGADGGGKILV